MQDENWTEVVTKLNRLTQEGKIKWEASLPPKNLVAGTDDKVVTVFYGNYRNRWIGLFERRYQGFDPDTETYYWTSQPIIGIFSGTDRDAVLLWEFPSVGTASDDLLESVRYQSVDGKQLLEELLSDEGD